jgi:hypothetical protein
MSNSGTALLGIGRGSGPDRAEEAIYDAINTPLLQGHAIQVRDLACMPNGLADSFAYGLLQMCGMHGGGLTLCCASRLPVKLRLGRPSLEHPGIGPAVLALMMCDGASPACAVAGACSLRPASSAT